MSQPEIGWLKINYNIHQTTKNYGLITNKNRYSKMHKAPDVT